MPRFSKKDRRELMSLNDKFKALHSTMILDKFNQKIEECSSSEEIIAIMNSTEAAIKMLYRPKSYQAKPTIKILGLISKETLYDEKKRIIVRKEQRITKLMIKKIQENNFGEILVEEDESLDLYKVMEIMITHVLELLPDNKIKKANGDSIHITFNNIMNSFLEEAQSTSEELIATSNDI